MKNRNVVLGACLLLLVTGGMASAQNMVDVNGSAAKDGSFGMETISDGSSNSMFVQDDSPELETVYRASFWFNPNDLPLANGQAHFILAGNMPKVNGDPGFSPKLQLEIRKRANGNSFRVRVASWSGSIGNPTRHYTAFIALTRTDWHQLQIEWRRSTSNVTADGFHRLSIIGGPQAGQSVEIANVTKDANVTVDRVQMGVISGYDGAVGSSYYDSFESFRTLAP